MPRSNPTIGIAVKEALRENPTSPSRTIARLLLAKFPKAFKDSEQARDIVRYYRGAHGDKNRDNIDKGALSPRVIVPESDEPEYEPYVFGEKDYPVIIGGDAHFPYHDREVLEIFLDRTLCGKFNTLLLNGDWLDMHSMSNFLRDPTARDIAGEVEMLRGVLSQIRKASPKMKIVYKIGNHEERLENYIKQHAPELFHLATARLDSLLGLDDLGIEIVSDKRIMRLGGLYVVHGHEYRFAIQNPVNPARGLRLRAKKSSLCAHFHRTSEDASNGINGKVTTCFSVGCLCGLHPQYMPLNDWNHGFAEVENEDGYFSVRNRKIVNYRIV